LSTSRLFHFIHTIHKERKSSKKKETTTATTILPQEIVH
jgi:hypothetical protein